MIKIDIDFNLNVLLKLFFSLSKKIIFLLPILANNNQVLKIYCENITIVFPSFFLLHIRTAFPFFFFLFFSPPHTYPYTFLFLLLSSFVTYYFLQTPERSSSPSTSFFFSPFSLSTSFLPLLKIYPYSFLFFLLSSIFPLLFSALCFSQNVPQTHRALLQSFFLLFLFPS